MNSVAGKDVDLYYKKSVELFEKGEFDKSLKVLDTVLKIDKNYIPAWNCKAVAHMEKNELPAALNSFEHVIELNPGDNLAWYNKGYVLVLMDEYEEAKKVFDFFLARYENKSDDFYKFGLYLRSKSYYGLKDYENALISVDYALEMDENFKEAIELKESIEKEINKK